MTILVTGTAGFIGNEVAARLLDRGETVIGVDNLNDYYDRKLKLDRLARIADHPDFVDNRGGIEDRDAIATLFRIHRPKKVIHLAAQAGVRYSLDNPEAYVDSNLVGFANILEGCRHNDVEHLVFASSSSVYGSRAKVPFSVADPVDHPISLYAATKRSNELMAHVYGHLYRIPVTGLRFFTVYGPWGRPDMAVYLFTKAILAGEPIRLFNQGRMERSFTYIDDIVEGVLRIVDCPPQVDEMGPEVEVPPSSSATAPFRINNIGRAETVALGRLVEALESGLGKQAIKEYLPMQPGDVPRTSADVSDLKALIGYEPKVSLEEGIERYLAWFKDYYRTH